MNSLEKKGCKSILKKLSQADLLSLKDTVTKKLLAAENVHEAIKIIVLYSQTSAELLRRKKIRRDVLFQYLTENGVVVPVTAEKNQLISKCLELWGSDVNQNSLQYESDDELPLDANDQQTLGNRTQPAATITSNSIKTEPPDHQQSVVGTQQNFIQTSAISSVTTNSDINIHQHSGLQGTHQATTSGPVSNSIISQQRNEVQISDQSLVNGPEPSSSIAATNDEQQQLGETFASWFYRILNSHNPTMGQTAEDFGPHHFWNDVTLNLTSVTPQPSSDSYSGSVLVSQRFLALVREELLLFNPNVSRDGVNVRSDRHGLTSVLVCGTLHRHSECLGIFQQVFGLVRDPRFENNWKIKTTKLRIQSTQVTALPRLQDRDNSELLALGDV